MLTHVPRRRCSHFAVGVKGSAMAAENNGENNRDNDPNRSRFTWKIKVPGCNIRVKWSGSFHNLWMILVCFLVAVVAFTAIAFRSLDTLA